MRTRSISRFLAVATFALCGSVAVRADDAAKPLRPLATDRPDLTESPLTLDEGHAQFEMDLAVASLAGDGAPELTASYGILNAKLGLSPDLDVQFLFPGWTSSAAGTGLGSSFGARLKLNLLGNEGGDVALGVLPWVEVDRLSLSPTLGLMIPATFTLPWDFALASMVAVEEAALDDDPYLEAIATASLSHTIWEGLGGFVEVAGGIHAASSVSPLLIASTGLTWLVTENVQWDAGLRVPVVGEGQTIDVFVGLSLRR